MSKATYRCLTEFYSTLPDAVISSGVYPIRAAGL